MNRNTELLTRAFDQFSSDDWEDEDSNLESQHLETLYNEYCQMCFEEELSIDTPAEFLQGLDFLGIYETSEQERRDLVDEFDWELDFDEEE